jgi:beta-N-acetylhexosaminidase
MGMLLLLTLAGCALPFGGSPSRAPTPTATARPPTLDELAARMVSRMSQDDKLGQMLVMQFTETTYTAAQAAMVSPIHPGGVILYRNAMGTAQQVKDLLASAQHDSSIPMFTFLTLEGGSIDPLNQYLGPRPSPPQLAATGRPAAAQSAGAKAAKDLLSFGFNADLAPYVQIGSGSAGDSRSWGNTPDLVTTFGGAWLTGLQTNGVVGCAKPFPGGQGAAADLAPYRTLIASNQPQTSQLQMILSTTETIPALDPSLPAALSKLAITGVLRDELGFNGIAITDVLYLTNVAKRFPFAQAAVMAVEAGNDMVTGLFSPAVMGDVVAALKAEIARGKLAQQQVDASVMRILALKMRYHIIAAPATASGVNG